MFRHGISVLLAVILITAGAACRRASPDPLISGQRLSAWIACLEDRDPEVQLKALRAIGKLARGSRKKPDGTFDPPPRATDAEAAYQPLKAMGRQPLTLPVALTVQYDLWTLFQETNSGHVETALQMLAHGSDDESIRAVSLLEHYPDKAGRITDTALSMILESPARPLRQASGILLLCWYPAAGWPKISQAQSTGTDVDKILFTSAKRQVREKAIAAGVIPIQPPLVSPTPDPSLVSMTPSPTASAGPDWFDLAVQAQASAVAWEARYWTLNSEYATRFAHVPHNTVVPFSSPANSRPLGGQTPQGRFQLWDQRGKEWRAGCEDLQRRINAGIP